MNIFNYDDDDDYEFEHLTSIEKLLEDDSSEEYTYLEKVKIDRRPSRYKLITRRIDSNRIRHKNAKALNIHTCICKNVNINSDISTRSGAIIYTHHKGKTYFCMGVDSSYGDLTDFAGGVKKDESVIDGGLRELYEESQGIFGDMTKEDVADCLTFYSSNMMIMFIRLDLNMEATVNEFSKRIKNKIFLQNENDVEVSNIIWLEEKDFLDAILGKGKHVYTRVRKILSKVTDIIQAL